MPSVAALLQASEQSCAADEDLRTGCAGTCFTLATCHGEADTDECARALRCRELKDEDASCSAHVARDGCDTRALKRCYLSCARADLAGLLRTYRNKYTVRTRRHGLLDDDAGPLGFVGGLSAEVGAAEGRSARGPPLPCWKGTPFDTRPAATCESPRAAVLQRWRAMAEPRCRALRQLTPRAARRRVLVGAAGASALGHAHNSSIPLNSPARLAADLALPAGLEMVVVPVLASPKVRLVESFVDASEAEHIIRIGLPGMRRSMAGAREESIRTSTTAMLPTNDPVVAAITRRASVLTGYPVDYIEPLQLVRYTSGQRCADCGGRGRQAGCRGARARGRGREVRVHKCARQRGGGGRRGYRVARQRGEGCEAGERQGAALLGAPFPLFVQVRASL